MTALLLAATLLTPGAQAAPTLRVQARAIRPGELLLVVVEGHHPRRAPAARFAGAALDFFPAASTGTWLAFLGLDLDVSTGPAPLAVTTIDPAGRKRTRTETLDVAPGEFQLEQIAVAPKYVTPSKSDEERAEGEAAKLRWLFSHGDKKRLFQGRFDPPIPGARSARFGARRVFNGQPRAPHSGMDLRARAGTPVRAPAAGRVALAGSLYFSGKTVILDHGLGLMTLYAHLSKILVRPGELVSKGRVIGRVGRTGRATGPHLHWALKFDGSRIDPYSLTALDLDAYLALVAPDPLRRSPDCARTDLPPAPGWGRAVRGLRARARPLKNVYAPGEPMAFLVEIQNVGRRSAFLDFVRDAQSRAVVLGFNGPPQPFSTLPSSASARLTTEQVKIPPRRDLCFAQDRDATGPLRARETTGYALSYDTEFLYSTATARAGLWRGRLTAPTAQVVVSTATP